MIWKRGRRLLARFSPVLRWKITKPKLINSVEEGDGREIQQEARNLRQWKGKKPQTKGATHWARQKRFMSFNFVARHSINQRTSTGCLAWSERVVKDGNVDCKMFIDANALSTQPLRAETTLKVIKRSSSVPHPTQPHLRASVRRVGRATEASLQIDFWLQFDGSLMILVREGDFDRKIDSKSARRDAITVSAPINYHFRCILNAGKCMEQVFQSRTLALAPTRTFISLLSTIFFLFSPCRSCLMLQIVPDYGTYPG